ncbi:hypothetical protein MTR67_032192 [Solanum verrucosum]|uniref:Uncharacterized protein n=1 Tax=Solanum verrucosum TaxID=315347 RepID=A0AAF0ZGA8_SOLVR|nr:hypothetical protein MTR67_032192 [Solanum verrucosum]
MLYVPKRLKSQLTLFYTPVAAELWHMLTVIFGISWKTPNSLKEAVESWSLGKVDRVIKKIWQMIPACIFWCLWTERNIRCIDGTSTPNCALKSKCLVNFFSWIKLSPIRMQSPFRFY